MKHTLPLTLFLLFAFLSSSASAGEGHVTIHGEQILYNGQPIKIVGLRCSNALINDDTTDDLIASLDTYRSYGVNTVSVFLMGSRFGDVQGYRPDGSLDPAHRERFERILRATDQRGMITIVGCLYWSVSKAKEDLGDWTQADADRAIANTARWLAEEGFAHVILDPDNEGMAVRDKDWSVESMIRAAKEANPSLVVANNTRQQPSNEDLNMHFGEKEEGKPWFDSESTPKNAPGGYWGKFSKENYNTDNTFYNYSRIGRYTEEMKEDQFRQTREGMEQHNGIVLASTWLQCSPKADIGGPFASPGGRSELGDAWNEDIDRLHPDAGLLWWFEFVQQHYGPSVDERTKQLAEANRILEATEGYTGFLAAEKELLSNHDAEYQAARDAYLLANYVENRLDQNPRKSLPTFMQAVGDRLPRGEARQQFNDSAWNAGMMLLEDHPSFDVPLDGIEVEKGIVFARNPELELELDLFLPKNRDSKPIPCIVCIHGGGWRVHRRAWFNGHAAYFASKGYAAVSIDYRMFPAIESPLPCIEDCKAAVRWIRANAEKYGIDPNRIGAVGGSAGAHLTAMLATTADMPELEGKGGNADQPSAIQAGVGYATPVYRLTEENIKEYQTRWGFNAEPKLLSPHANVDENDAPLLLIHGENDGLVPIDNALDMHAKYQAAGADSELITLPDKGHVFYTCEEAAEWALKFFQSRFEDKP